MNCCLINGSNSMSSGDVNSTSNGTNCYIKNRRQHCKKSQPNGLETVIWTAIVEGIISLQFSLALVHLVNRTVLGRN